MCVSWINLLSTVYNYQCITTTTKLCIFVVFQYNNVDFLTITPEKASTELNKPCAFVRMQAQYNPASK